MHHTNNNNNNELALCTEPFTLVSSSGVDVLLSQLRCGTQSDLQTHQLNTYGLLIGITIETDLNFEKTGGSLSTGGSKKRYSVPKEVTTAFSTWLSLRFAFVTNHICRVFYTPRQELVTIGSQLEHSNKGYSFQNFITKLINYIVAVLLQTISAR